MTLIIEPKKAFGKSALAYLSQGNEYCDMVSCAFEYQLRTWEMIDNCTYKENKHKRRKKLLRRTFSKRAFGVIKSNV